MAPSPPSSSPSYLDAADVSTSSPARSSEKRKFWSEAEDQPCIKLMRTLLAEHHYPRLQDLWDTISVEMTKQGMNRLPSAVKSTWHRRLRAASGIDEKKRNRPEEMATSLLGKRKSRGVAMEDSDNRYEGDEEVAVKEAQHDGQESQSGRFDPDLVKPIEPPETFRPDPSTLATHLLQRLHSYKHTNRLRSCGDYKLGYSILLGSSEASMRCLDEKEYSSINEYAADPDADAFELICEISIWLSRDGQTLGHCPHDDDSLDRYKKLVERVRQSEKKE
ncbi:hypothetical protein LTR66_009412 [Elasticomyces elasticus]|nr:hypothetical protein LTR66_009412 [Elasticomyces elasticus]